MYEVILKPLAEKFLKKLDNSIQKQIIKKLKELKENPQLGKPLLGNLAGLWSLRVNKYRAIYQIISGRLIIEVLEIGHRKNIYD
jgi:mRNA interferase RelE/StbE